jgi:hypothetical protein
MLRFITALALAGSVALAACGGDEGGRADKGPDGVRATVKEFTTSFKDKKFGGACALMTPAARGQVVSAGQGQPGAKAQSCPRLLALARAFTPDAQLAKAVGQADELDVTVDGDRATSEATRAGGTGGKYRYVDGEWFIASRSGQ